MARLTSPTGITVNVSDEKAEQLKSVGYKAEASGSTKTSSKKSTPSKSEK